MRRLMMLVLVAGVPVHAMAECNSGNANTIVLTGWSAEPNGEHATKVTINFKSQASKGLEMVDATAWFDDALGDNIGGISLDPDPQLAPGGSATEISNMAGFQRLTKAKAENIRAYICVKSVLYSDGTKETFD